jgi:hypothetical protein
MFSWTFLNRANKIRNINEFQANGSMQDIFSPQVWEDVYGSTAFDRLFFSWITITLQQYNEHIIMDQIKTEQIIKL